MTTYWQLQNGILISTTATQILHVDSEAKIILEVTTLLNSLKYNCEELKKNGRTRTDQKVYFQPTRTKAKRLASIAQR